ncbi:TCP-1 chaperonin subunit eta [Giardia muris]|uniref:T-complex protein 1 subunit eta n=1 Tax=Giardia muris TaxID=5742 RepID=A0A4Z1SNM2_GIAMU|nr:TCP-1 chaperonin subunit eta [Giardia muris]|eukprot:TNJ27240.1 TCP-1 chaperonin subunit eta [Giardia muris]
MRPSRFGLQPTILLLREGTDTSQGKGQLLTNINACVAVSDMLQTTLGPRGMDKLIVTKGKATVSNDGATIIGLLDIVHPAARCLVDIAKSQDGEIGDGTTSVVVLAGALLRACIPLIEANVHPNLIKKTLNSALNQCIARIHELEVHLGTTRDEQFRKRLETLAGTSMNSKLISPCKAQFSKMVVDAVLSLLDPTVDQTSQRQLLSFDMLGIKKVLGGALQDSQLIFGVAFKKTFSYAGHEQLPKRIENPKILCLNVELEWQAEKDNAEVRLTDPTKFRQIVDAEFQIIYAKLEKIVKDVGATVVLSNKSIGDLATQFFADHRVFCAGRVSDEDLSRIERCSGARLVSAVSDLTEASLGTRCGLFEEKQVGNERFNFFTSFSADVRTCTFILRGGADQFIDESERSLHDAICVVRRAIRHPTFVAGGGSLEMALSALLLKHAKTISGKAQSIYEAVANALEAVPRNLCENAGFDAMEIITKLRLEHTRAARSTPPAPCWLGVDIQQDHEVLDCMEAGIWEPSLVRINALQAAFEAASVILSVDQTLTFQSETKQLDAGRETTATMKQKLADAGMGGSIAGQGMKMFQGNAGK